LLVGTPNYSEGVSWSVATSATTVYAFEVVDPSLTYAAASVKRLWGGAKTWLKDASRVFLVGVHEGDDFAAAAEQRLATVWENDDSDPPITDAVQKCLARSEPLAADSLAFPDGARVVASFCRSTPQLSEVAKPLKAVRSPSEPRAFGGCLTVVLNPAFKFSLGRLSRGLDAFATTVGGAPSDEKLSLRDCFAYLSEPEMLDENNQWFCPNCRKHVCAEKVVAIWKVPEVLIIQLKRFVRARFSGSKMDAFVSFPDFINMREYIAGPQNAADQAYRLYAVSNHMGGLGGGHYTANAIVQDPDGEPDEKGEWYSFNDGSAGPARKDAWHSASAYVLFYEKIEGSIPGQGPGEPELTTD
jgi:hypothetical protein